MFELTGLSTFLDIFQKAFGLIEKRKDQKRRLFEEIVEPVYKELSVVVENYYGFFRSFRDQLSQTPMPVWATVLYETKKKREEIVLARNKVLGLTYPFISAPNKIKGKEDELLYKFAKAINEFFYASDDVGMSVASSLFSFIEWIAEQCEDAPYDLFQDGPKITAKEYEAKVFEKIEEVLKRLEWSWRDISAAYGERRVHCLS